MIIKRKWLVGLFFLMWLSLDVSASEMVFQTTDELIEYGVRHSKNIQSKYATWQAALEEAEALGSLSDPKVGVRFNGTPSKSEGTSFDQTRYIASQAFPFFGVLGNQIRLGNQKAEKAYIAYLEAKNQLVIEILESAYDYQLNQELIEINLKNKNVLEKLIRISDVKYQAGVGLQANVLKATVAKNKLEEELLSLAHERIIILESLKQLISASESVKIELLGAARTHLFPNIEVDISRWVNDSLSVRHAVAKHEVSVRKLAVEKDQFLPDFSAQIEYWDNGATENQFGGQLMMTVPWFNSRNSSSVKRAGLQLDGSQAGLEDARAKALAKLTILNSEIQTVEKTIQLYETTLLKHARLAMANFQQAYEVDKASFIDYFDAEQTIYQLETRYAKLTNRYHTAVARLTWQFENGEFPNEK